MPATRTQTSIPVATIATRDAEEAADALLAQLGPGPHAAVMVFASPTIDRPALAAAMQARFEDTPVLGATTAGEIGLGGLRDGCVTAAALPTDHFRVAWTVIEDLRAAPVEQGRSAAHEVLQQLSDTGPAPTVRDSIALLLVDGLSVAEERLASTLFNELGDIRLVGGSAGDGLEFGSTAVFADGRAHDHGAVVALLQTDLPFTDFRTQNFVPSERRMVVTSADAARRVVHELDGEPAAAYLAASLSMSVDDLGPAVFAIHPVVVRIGGCEYVRSIQKVEDDGSLTFYCAIEEGVVLRDADAVGIVDNLEAALADVRQQVGEPQLTIAFDCIQRRLACIREDTVAPVGAALERARSIGFSTYGEQFGGMHVNQTLTGVAFGFPRD
ncbi:MAG: FIST N-terminal domain-containing protein [Planctomycetota bacterium]